ncbi:hypothetical protein TWF569_008762 [Orbilia oligospora]|nr:hypothetical protein TWF569_008762 [Orbilia oligospora]KAF3149386.1 hypothetical protein TWF594_011427 [Orbilia oligospora]
MSIGKIICVRICEKSLISLSTAATSTLKIPTLWQLQRIMFNRNCLGNGLDFRNSGQILVRNARNLPPLHDT